MPGEVPLVGETATRRCLLCGSAEFTDMVTANQVTMRRCRQCGLWVNATAAGVFVPEEHYAGDYHQLHYGRSARRKQRTSAHMVRALEALRPGKGRLLDIGCSFGHFLAAAQARGWEAHGVDLAPDVVASGCERGLPMHLGSLSDLPFPDNHFDVVHARHVLEHDIEIYRSLAEIRRVLVEGGLLVVAVPDGDCPKVRRRGTGYTKFWKIDHLLCFTRPTLAALMEKTGFAPVAPSPLAGLTAGGLRGGPAFLGWRLSQIVADACGWGNTLRTVWRKT